MPTPSDFVPLLDALGAAEPAEGLAALNALGDRMREELDDEDEAALESLWERFGAIQRRLEGEQILRSADPLAAALAAKRPDLVARIGSDAAFASALEQALAHVGKPYYSTDAGWIHALAPLATTEERRARVVAELGGAIRRMVDARLAGGELVNSVAFVACARALGLLQPVEATPQLEAALRFCVERRCHYEALQAGGPLAIALAAAGARDGVPAVRGYLDRWESVYPGEPFVMEARYALWLLDGDGAGARAFLEDDAHTKGHGFAVAALADLHDAGAVPVVEARLARITNPVTREVFAEGLARLRAQTAPPAPADRMIRLFGVRTRTEQALGADSDDVFVQRARAKLGDVELGRVTEVDDAADAD